MGFAGVYTALYDYQPQTEQELEISEGDLLYVIDIDSEDGWWKAKKKTAEIDADEPVGLVPNNYIEEVRAFFEVATWRVVLYSLWALETFTTSGAMKW